MKRMNVFIWEFYFFYSIWYFLNIFIFLAGLFIQKIKT